jgi:hypothetical protein
MNLVGKIFIVLIFVMSILFMGFVVAVYATHTNWRDAVKNPDSGLETQLKNEKAEVDKLANQMAKTQEELETEKAARQNQIAKLVEKSDKLAEDREQLTKDIATERELKRDAIAAMDAAHKTLDAMRVEVERLRGDIATAMAVRDESLTMLVSKTDEANGLAMQMQTLNKRTAEVAEQLQKATDVLRKFGLDAEPEKYAGVPTREVSGVVSVVRPDGIGITIGSDDGLLKGHRLDVYRTGGQGTYLGKIEVIYTYPDKAVCKVLPEFRKGIIQANDRVTTGLKSQ